jgi:O-antigen ligase
MLGRPLQFAHMQLRKAWNMWSFPWSGGNSIGGGGLARTTSLLQHQIYSAIAWLGVVLGLVLLRRRWSYVVPVLALLGIAWLNTFFAITPRDNVRFLPLVFAYGAVGLAAAGTAIARRVRIPHRAGDPKPARGVGA